MTALDTDDRSTAAEGSPRRTVPPWCTALAALLALLCPPIVRTVPAADLDSSWQLGLSLVHLHGIHAGPGFVFTYGPLGFLASPDLVWLPGAVLGLLYLLATGFALYGLVLRNLRVWTPGVAAALVTVGFASIVARVAAAPEVASTALVLWALSLVLPGRRSLVLAPWVPVVFGTLAALQLLVKTSVGVMALAAAVTVAVARPAVVRNLLVTLGAFVVGVALWWTLAGQPLGNLVDWIRASAQEAGGYSSAMAATGEPYDRQFWPLLVVLLALVAIALWRGLPHHRSSLPFVLLFGASCWLFVKEGFVRLDGAHLPIAFLGIALLVTAIPLPGARPVLGFVTVAALLVVTLLAMVDAPRILGNLDSTIREVVTVPTDTVPEVARIVRATVQPSYRREQLAAAAQSIRRAQPLPPSVVRALRGREVHAEPWDIATVWAYGVRWAPAPVFQSYDAYTAALDDRNAAAFAGPGGPDAVLRRVEAIDRRLPAWESPQAMVRLTCDYEMMAKARGWQALVRRSGACGRARVVATRTVAPGARVAVPAPSLPGAIVVASFDVPNGVLDRVVTLLVKPPRRSRVGVDGVRRTFVAGTAAQQHLLHVPRTIGGRRPTNAGLDIRTIAFPDATGPVTVTFSELPPL